MEYQIATDKDSTLFLSVGELTQLARFSIMHTRRCGRHKLATNMRFEPFAPANNTQ
jgi:hypothetical protein